MSQGLALLESSMDEGSHRLIHQPELRWLWRKVFKAQYEVPWRVFWAAFPVELKKLVGFRVKGPGFRFQGLGFRV